MIEIWFKYNLYSYHKDHVHLDGTMFSCKNGADPKSTGACSVKKYILINLPVPPCISDKIFPHGRKDI